MRLQPIANIALRALIFVLFFSCTKEDDTVRNNNKMLGMWNSASKGYILEIKEDQKNLYSYSSAGCSVLVEDFIPKYLYGLELRQIDENQLIASSEILLTDISFRRLQNENQLCAMDAVANTDDPLVNFDHFWSAFNEHYAFFEKRNINWNEVKNLREKITKENFYELIENVLHELGDGHVDVEDEALGIEIDSGLPNLIGKLNTYLEGDLMMSSKQDLGNMLNQKVAVILEKYLHNKYKIDDNNNMIWGLIDEEISYLNILGMEDYASKPEDELSNLNTLLDRIMQDIQESGTNKLILDIRFNSGGFDLISMDIASRFFDQKRPVFSKKERLGNGFTEEQTFSVSPKGDFQFTGEIILLTSAFTASAAEVFTMCMKELPYTTIIGENTRGIFSDVLTHALPNGAEITMSNEVFSDAHGIVFEVEGIGPNASENNIPFLISSDILNNKDGGIEKAMELLNN